MADKNVMGQPNGQQDNNDGSSQVQNKGGNYLNKDTIDRIEQTYLEKDATALPTTDTKTRSSIYKKIKTGCMPSCGRGCLKRKLGKNTFDKQQSPNEIWMENLCDNNQQEYEQKDIQINMSNSSGTSFQIQNMETQDQLPIDFVKDIQDKSKGHNQMQGLQPIYSMPIQPKLYQPNSPSLRQEIMIDLSNQEPHSSYYSYDQKEEELDDCMGEFRFLCNGLLKLDQRKDEVSVITQQQFV